MYNGLVEGVLLFVCLMLHVGSAKCVTFFLRLRQGRVYLFTPEERCSLDTLCGSVASAFGVVIDTLLWGARPNVRRGLDAFACDQARVQGHLPMY